MDDVNRPGEYKSGQRSGSMKQETEKIRQAGASRKPAAGSNAKSGGGRSAATGSRTKAGSGRDQPARTTPSRTDKRAGRKGQTANTGRKQPVQAKTARFPAGAWLLGLVNRTFFGRLMLFLVILGVIIWLTWLFSADRYQVFFMSISIELLVALVVGWLVVVFKRN